LEKNEKKERVWELDAFRGIFILFMIAIHTIFDLTELFGKNIRLPEIYSLLKENGALLFILLSGICVTLGRRSLRRGAVVFGCGMLITLTMFFLAKTDGVFEGEQIYFGILHLLGVSMMLYPLFRPLPLWAKALAAAVFIGPGFYFQTLQSSFFPALVLGIKPKGFSSGDYFPLFPNFGWFLAGAVIGGTVYKNKKSLFPRFPAQIAPMRFLRFCGRHSLWIYLLHQPIIFGVLYVFTAKA